MGNFIHNTHTYISRESDFISGRISENGPNMQLYVGEKNNLNGIAI